MGIRVIRVRNTDTLEEFIELPQGVVEEAIKRFAEVIGKQPRMSGHAMLDALCAVIDMHGPLFTTSDVEMVINRTNKVESKKEEIRFVRIASACKRRA